MEVAQFFSERTEKFEIGQVACWQKNLDQFASQIKKKLNLYTSNFSVCALEVFFFGMY